MAYPKTPEEWQEWLAMNGGSPGGMPDGDMGGAAPDLNPETPNPYTAPPSPDPGGNDQPYQGQPYSPDDSSPTGDGPATADPVDIQWGPTPDFEFQMPGGFERSEHTVPPPPPPPPYVGGGGGGSFGTTIGTPGPGPEFQAPDAPDAAPDFQAILDQYLNQGTGFQRPDMPGEAPDFQGIADGMPEYQTPDNAFLGENLYGRLEDYAMEWMDNPNRYASELAEQTRAEGQERRAHEQSEQTRKIEEWAASRGLNASSLEGGLMVELGAAMDRATSQEELQLLQQLADAEVADREAAGLYGTRVADLGRSLGETRIAEAQGAQELALSRTDRQLRAAELQEAAEMGRAQFGLDIENAAAEQGFREAGLALQAAEMEEAANRFRSQFELQVADMGFDAAFRNHQLEQQRMVRQAELDLQAAIAGEQAAAQRMQYNLDLFKAQDAAVMNREQIRIQDEQIDLRAWEIMSGYEMQGQEMEYDHAKWLAELDYRKTMFEADEQYRRDQAEEDTRRWDLDFDEGRRQHDDWVDVQSSR